MEETCLEDGPAVNFERATLEIASTDRESRRPVSPGLTMTVFNNFRFRDSTRDKRLAIHRRRFV